MTKKIIAVDICSIIKHSIYRSGNLCKMKKRDINAFLIILSMLFMLITACATRSVPNPSYIYRIPSIRNQLKEELKRVKKKEYRETETLPAYEVRVYSLFEKFYQKNPLLAEELGKLPEFQDGISTNEVSALEKIVELYDTDTAVFDNAFKQMYQVGKADVRKYCSPLQALYWLAEDGELSSKNNPLDGYSLRALLFRAWKFKVYPFTTDEQVLLMSDEQMLEVIDGIKDEDMKELYLRDMQYDKKLRIQKALRNFYTLRREKLSKGGRQIIEQTLMSRWAKFNAVVDRLNAPELVDYYEKQRIKWVDFRTLPSPVVTPWYVFKYNIGDCVSITGFTVYCLQKGGYKARELRVPSLSSYYQFHAVCLFEMHGKKYIMDNGTLHPKGIIPYEIYLAIRQY